MDSRRKNPSQRTTLTLSDEAAQIVAQFKAATGLSTSRAVDELILRNGPQPSYLVEENGLLILDAPVKGGRITTEDVKRLLEEFP